jgi:hypothetical protein
MGTEHTRPWIWGWHPPRRRWANAARARYRLLASYRRWLPVSVSRDRFPDRFPDRQAA